MQLLIMFLQPIEQFPQREMHFNEHFVSILTSDPTYCSLLNLAFLRISVHLCLSYFHAVAFFHVFTFILKDSVETFLQQQQV